MIGVLPPNFQLYQTAEIFAPIGLGLRASSRGERKEPASMLAAYDQMPLSSRLRLRRI